MYIYIHVHLRVEKYNWGRCSLVARQLFHAKCLPTGEANHGGSEWNLELPGIKGYRRINKL